MTEPAPGVVWFRNDLRIDDNPALCAAWANGPVIGLFVLDEGDGTARPLGGASRWWLDKSLRALGADLAARGIPLVLRKGAPARVLVDLTTETGARSIFWNRLYDTASVCRDRGVKQALRDRGLEARSYNGGLLNEPWQVKSGAGGAYRVFTPYWRAARPLVDATGVGPGPSSPQAPLATPAGDTLDDWGLHPEHPDWSAGLDLWKPGEAGALARLDSFLGAGASAYAETRDRPDLAGVSRLSPHLHFGEISPRRIWRAVEAARVTGEVPERDADAFLRQLGWREFNHHLAFHFPQMAQSGFNPRFQRFPWVDDPGGLEAWRRGRTGYPIVDAGMRELWTTGWMHNRVRMIAASFLIKHLMISWREGEAWFWDTLVDADLANNLAGWQWVAGCGADAAPYFRIFNPVLQGEKFDPGGDYVRQWAPELARLPNACIHQPWRADSRILAAAGVRLGVTYPTPIVDHAAARERALTTYERLQ